MLPSIIRTIVWQFHDEFNLIEKRARINSIIKNSYHNWLLDAGVYSRWFSVDEFAAKSQMFPYVSDRIQITNITKWKFFLSYFLFYELRLESKLPCLPSVYGI